MHAAARSKATSPTPPQPKAKARSSQAHSNRARCSPLETPASTCALRLDDGRSPPPRRAQRLLPTMFEREKVVDLKMLVEPGFPPSGDTLRAMVASILLSPSVALDSWAMVPALDTVRSPLWGIGAACSPVTGHLKGNGCSLLTGHLVAESPSHRSPQRGLGAELSSHAPVTTKGVGCGICLLSASPNTFAESPSHRSPQRGLGADSELPFRKSNSLSRFSQPLYQ